MGGCGTPLSQLSYLCWECQGWARLSWVFSPGLVASPTTRLISHLHQGRAGVLGCFLLPRIHPHSLCEWECARGECLCAPSHFAFSLPSPPLAFSSSFPVLGSVFGLWSLGGDSYIRLSLPNPVLRLGKPRSSQISFSLCIPCRRAESRCEIPSARDSAPHLSSIAFDSTACLVYYAACPLDTPRLFLARLPTANQTGRRTSPSTTGTNLSLR